ncbi:hypothetical protein NQZ79_g5343 [Umbelopsis isabellina]|nr:hypothetical protein NQZ79_g5343 [Umbelopsis isabellina]
MSTRVYLGRLARDCRDRDIEKLFRGYGDIREINLKNGFGFVEFRDNRDAEDVVYDFHGKEFLGERLIVEIARGNRRREDRGGRGGRRDEGRSQYRLIVNGIASGTSWQDLKDFMRKAGEVSFADILKDRDGEGVVEFRSRSDMKAALERLDGQELNGREVTLREAERERRSNRRSRSRSDSRSPPRRSRRRSPSHSRSRSPRRSSRRDRDRDSDDRRRRTPSPDRSVSRERDDEKRSSSRRERSASRSASPPPAKDGYSDRSRSGSPAPRDEEGDVR